MKKNEYLNELRKILKNNFVDPKETEQIISDYEELFQEGLEQGLTDEEVSLKLGKPESVYQSLKHDLKYQGIRHGKVVGVMVFVAVIIFFVLGYRFGLWAYSWLAFFLIPMTAIIFNLKDKNEITGLVVFISVIIFYVFGMKFRLWHPLWLVFLSIPMSAILLNIKKKSEAIGLLPFVSIIAYVLIAYFYPFFYKSGWTLIFLTPIVSSFIKPFSKRKIFMGIILILSVIAYTVLSLRYDNWRLTLLVFLVPFFYALFTKLLKVEISLEYLFRHPYLFTFLILVVAAYLALSIALGAWAWTWTILLFIPMAFIFEQERFKSIVSYTPFISLMLFFLIGYFIKGAFSWSWLFFLIIPVTGILSSGEDKKSEDKNQEKEETTDEEAN